MFIPNLINATFCFIHNFVDTWYILWKDDTANGEREKQFKEHEMMKKFKREQQILHAQVKHNLTLLMHVEVTSFH